MKVSATDPRSIRSRRELQAALMRLVTERHSAALSVQEVTRAARLNRTTFYLHYNGLPELLEDCARALFARMRAEIYAHKMVPSWQDRKAFVPFVQSVFEHLQEHEDFYRIMLGRQGDPLFKNLFQEFLSDLIFEPLAGQDAGLVTSAGLEMKLRFFSAGFTGVAVWWLEKGRPISAEDAALQVARDILSDYLHLMGGRAGGNPG